MAKGCLATLFGFGTRDGRAARKARAQQEAAKSGNRTADDVTPLLAAGVILGASGTASSDDPKNGGMNEGDFHSGPEGYSPNTGYPDTFYGSGDFGGFDSGGDGGGGGD